ncbi:conjugal transfer protein TraF [Desulfurispira natronophila]|uniref:Uncharacterized protein n=1 Tax=Desulfurispira natronophila TaxID=682562 RepID=A0A7W7Y2Z5_9BACT|nr:conjugal transfer protein TraF [Desulfurispira natronophila]MBB5021146.1 hypothetical protein [Desulfurispira natronophila]
MKRLCSALLLALVPVAAYAAPHSHPSGPNLTFGDISNPQTVLSVTGNPASGAAAEQRGIRFGLLSSIGFSYEIGDMDNIIDDMDDFLEEDFGELEFTSDLQGLQSMVREYDRLESRFNNFLETVSEDGYIKLGYSAHVPLTPVVATYDFLGGTLALDANFSGQGRITIQGEQDGSAPVISHGIDPTLWSILGDSNITSEADLLAEIQDQFSEISSPVEAQDFLDERDTTITTDARIVGEAAQLREVALSYSGAAWHHQDGSLYLGGKLKHYSADLTKIDKNIADEDGDGAFDTLSDEIGENTHNSTDFGVDLGLLWTAPNYRVGGTLVNVNEPSFRHIDGDRRSLDQQLRLEGAVFTANRNWVFGFAYDVDSANNLIGDEYQWMTLSAGYATQSWWIPGVRLGYRENLTGTKLSYISGGITLFRVANLDVAYSTDSVSGEDIPRSAIVNLGLEITF